MKIIYKHFVKNVIQKKVIKYNMAKKRYINTKFWSDNFVVELEPLDRYIFLYFLTNEHTNIAGIYELPIRTMSFETGIEKEELLKILERLKGKIHYIDGWVFIHNFAKHQAINDSVKKGIERVFNELPREIIEKLNTMGIGYGQAVDSLPPSCDLLELKPKPKLNIRAEARTDKIMNYKEPTIELDGDGEEKEIEPVFKVEKGMSLRIIRHYMKKFNVPEVKGVFFTYRKYVNDMIGLSKEIHGENNEMIEKEIIARIDIARKYSEKMGWTRMKLATIIENWNIILDEWRREVEI